MRCVRLLPGRASAPTRRWRRRVSNGDCSNIPTTRGRPNGRAARAGGAALRPSREDQGLAAGAGRSDRRGARRPDLWAALRAPSRNRRDARGTTTMTTSSQKLEQEQIAKLTRRGQDARLRARRHGARQREGGRGHARARPGLRGRLHRPQNAGLNSSFTVRKISYGEGVERVFPLYSPRIAVDRGGAPRRRPPRQALLPARPPRQGGPHRREDGRSRRQGGRRRSAEAADVAPAPAAEDDSKS